MCGIAGIVCSDKHKPEQKILSSMIHTLRHRGPDETGFHADAGIGLAQSRLSIIDLKGGSQPVFNEDRTLSVILNGEIFNYLELRDLLIKKGHCFRTQSDTETLVHLYESFGLNMFQYLNGQFAFALWDGRKKKLLIARDRLGIRPLFYTQLPDQSLVFASEVKALLAHPDVHAEIDPQGLNQILTLWVTVPPRTVFRNIQELEPGHFLTIRDGQVQNTAYWKLTFPRAEETEPRPFKKVVQGFQEQLHNSVSLRLRADVPVASYLSGGIDSSVISALVKKHHNNDLMTFSVDFDAAEYSEGRFQKMMARHLNTTHHTICVDNQTVGDVFSDVIYFAEKPLLRTAPAPLYQLSGLVREHGIKVVLTGEGADEVLGGYNIFKEDKVRRFWAKDPASRMRPALLSRIYPYLTARGMPARLWQRSFRNHLTETEHSCYSHLIRWQTTGEIRKFLADAFCLDQSEEALNAALNQYLDPELIHWHPLSRAQYLEMKLFMPGYLLSSQGDRMMMAHSVEGRFPFLDHCFVEYAAQIPPDYKLRGLKEKYILKQACQHWLPEAVLHRDKQPYRAPVGQSFQQRNALIETMISKEYLEKTGYFNVGRVNHLFKKMEASGGAMSPRDDMAVAAVISTQLLHHHFIEGKTA